MKEVRKRKLSLTDAAGIACDPYGWFCVFLTFGKYWKAGLILLASIAIVGTITGFLVLWTNRWDI
jgi:hypothetical protein